MPQPPAQHDSPQHSGRNARYGLVLCAVYVALYGGFVALAVFDPQSLGRPVLRGVNLAIAYGLGLIAAALALALIYMVLCRRPAETAGARDRHG